MNTKTKAKAAKARKSRVLVEEFDSGWTWQLMGSNGSPLVQSGQFYSSKRNAIAALRRSLELLRAGFFVVIGADGKPLGEADA